MKARALTLGCVIGLLGFAQQGFAQYMFSSAETDQVAEQGAVAPEAYGVAVAESYGTGTSPTCDTCGPQYSTTGQCGKCGSSAAGRWCVSPCRSPRLTFFGDFLYLRARDAEVPFAVPIDGTVDDVLPVNQVGPITLTDPDYEPGFRVGGSLMLDRDAALAIQYTGWRSDTENAVSVEDTPGIVVRSLVGHPGLANVSHDGVTARAGYDIEFQLIDLDYRSVLFCNGRTSVSWLVGLSYGHLEEDFISELTDNGVNTVLSEVDFDGGGIRLGLEFERYARNSGLMVYGRSSARFLGGEFQADFFEEQLPGVPEAIDTTWEAGRLVTILDLELGVGWTSCSGCLRLSGGYMVSGWFNTVSTADWITGVQTNNYGDLDDNITFDGFTTRAEVRF